MTGDTPIVKTDEAILEEMEALQVKVERIESEPKPTVKGQAEIGSATFQMVCSLMVRMLRNKPFEDQISELKTENDLLKKQVLINEFDNCARAVLIKGIPIEKRSESGEESKIVLKTKVQKVLKVMKIDTLVRIDDVFRMFKTGEASAILD